MADWMLESTCAEDTFELGRAMAQKAVPGTVYCLDGDLGTGKTVFTQGFAAGLGIRGPVNSPTFTIMQSYESGRLPLYHFDVYRIGEEEELYEIGCEEYFYGYGVCLIEWASRFPEVIPEDAVWIRLEKDPARGFSYRRITVERPGGEEHENTGD